jgi:anti-sigma factor RsiW
MSYDFDSFLHNAFEPLRAVEPTPNEIRAILERTRRWRWPLRRRQTLVVALAALAIGGGATAALLDRDTQIDNQVLNKGPLKSSGIPRWTG